MYWCICRLGVYWFWGDSVSWLINVSSKLTGYDWNSFMIDTDDSSTRIVNIYLCTCIVLDYVKLIQLCSGDNEVLASLACADVGTVVTHGLRGDDLYPPISIRTEHQLIEEDDVICG